MAEVSRDHAGLDPLSYSDGNQYSIYNRDGARPPARLAATGSVRQVRGFFNWANSAGYGHVSFGGSSYVAAGLQPTTARSRAARASTGSSRTTTARSSATTTFDSDGKLSDDERDEDADGLTNYDESHGRMPPRLLERLLRPRGRVSGGLRRHEPRRRATPTATACATAPDDQDHDDIPNLMELSRNAATRSPDRSIGSDKDGVEDPLPTLGRVNPFNPCLPEPRNARTCIRHPGLGRPLRLRSTSRTTSSSTSRLAGPSSTVQGPPRAGPGR